MAEGAEDGISPQRLYERFRASAGRKSSNDFFDEDDLIDIFDYANDLNDDFIKMEVLFYAASRYPDSAELLERRRYLYYYLGYDEAVDLLLSRSKSKSVLSQLLALRRKSDRGESTTNGLARILATLDHKLNDEEVIQFLGEASLPENYNWLIENFDKLRECVEYLPTLLFEMTGVAMTQGDNATAIKMAEELTMLEPFNVEFWEMLAQAEYNAEDYKAVLTAVDYALAIEPHSERSLFLKAWALFNLDEDSPESEKILLSLYPRPNFDSVSMQTLILILDKKNECDKAGKLASDYVKRHPEARDVHNYLLMADADNLGDRVDALPGPPPGVDAQEYWVDWAMQHIPTGSHDIAAEILLRARAEGVLNEQTSCLYEELYRSGSYELILEIFEEDRDEEYAKRIEVYLAVIMSLVRLDRYEEARTMLEEIKSGKKGRYGEIYLRGSSKMFASLYKRGGISLLREMYDALKAPEKLPPDDFDPFL